MSGRSRGRRARESDRQEGRDTAHAEESDRGSESHPPQHPHQEMQQPFHGAQEPQMAPTFQLPPGVDAHQLMQVAAEAMLQYIQTAQRGNQPEASHAHSAVQSRAEARPLPSVAPAAPVVPPAQEPAQIPIRILTDGERLEYFKVFIKSNPPPFFGQIYGTVAEEWVR